MNAQIEIRDLHTYAEFENLRQLHQVIWDMPPGAGLYPPMLNTAAANGGVVLGAFDGDRMIGFSFGFLGRHPNGKLKLCSQTMGFLPEYRGRGLGARIKWAQRSRALQAGLELITWTFDPLEAPNARLNLHKLGAIAGTYLENMFGENFLRFGQGLPSDRLLAEWWIRTERVALREAQRLPGPVFDDLGYAARTSGAGLDRRIEELRLDLQNAHIAIEVPAHTQNLIAENPALALDWRLKTRRAFQTYFRLGYVAVDLVPPAAEPAGTVLYLLERTADLLVR